MTGARNRSLSTRRAVDGGQVQCLLPKCQRTCAAKNRTLVTFSIGPLPLKKKKMSVLLPPPKRQKVYHGIPEPENPQVSEESVPNVVVQFVNDQDGSPLAPAVNLPANVTKDALESLVNKLRPQVGIFTSRPLPLLHLPCFLLPGRRPSAVPVPHRCIRGSGSLWRPVKTRNIKLH